MRSLPFMLGALCVLALAYRYYSAFLAAKVLTLDSTRKTPAYTRQDGANFIPTSKWVLFGHHFAAIAGAGPLIGPVLAAQFGFLPGFLWILIGVVLAGATQDFVILFASTRRGGRSLVEIAREEIGPGVGLIAAIAVLFIIIVALAGLGLAVVNALQNSAWGIFAIGTTIPLALFMGWYVRSARPGKVAEASTLGVTGLLLAVIFGRSIPQTALGPFLSLSHNGVTWAMALYGLTASVMPVWMLLVPRDYLSSYLKIGTIAVLILGILWINPPIHMPLISPFVHGGGPIIPGKVFPFVFITIACGAISGFHALVGSGTTPKMIRDEMDMRAIGYGAMLLEGLVGITALVASSALYPGDYFALNVAPVKFAAMHLSTVNLTALAQQVGEPVAGRTGGAVSLAIGMAQVFTALPGMGRFMSYWYHFAILFEALFILTTIDAGTRVARFVLQELAGRVYEPFGRTHWWPGSLLASLLVVGGWVYFILTGSVATIWPMFGIANQLLAVIALAVGTVVIVQMGKRRFAWVTACPLLFISATTFTAGWLSIRDNFLPLAHIPGKIFLGYLNAALTAGMMACAAIILAAAVAKLWPSFRAASTPAASADPA